MPLLTIVIPTRNREIELDRCLSALTVATNAAGAENDVAVAVADNCSIDQTQEVVHRHARRNPWVKYYCHHEPRRTAEESLFHALAFAETDYVWALGDDDVVTENSLRLLLPILREGRVGLVLLNLISKTPDAEHSYYRFPYPSIFYQCGLDLFRDFGVISATTTISRLCFRRSGIQQVDWQRLQRLSPIYSHSCALLIAFRDVPALALGEPTVIYNQNLLAVEHERLSQVAVERQHPTYHAFTIGLIQLLREIARETGLPLADLLKIEEPELSKSDWRVKQSLTGHFIAHHLISQLSLGLGRASAHEWFSDDDIQTIRRFFRDSGDAELRQIVEQALDALSTPGASRRQTRRNQLASGQKKLFEREEEYFARLIHMSPDRRRAAILFDHQRPFKWSRGCPADTTGAPIAIQAAKTRLTILVPTYNRARNLARQLRILKRLPVSQRSDVEILVADNACSDRTARVLAAGARVLPALRALHFHEHVGSAEENIDRSVALASGDYIWLLGDDDEPIAPTISLLLHLLDYTQPDGLVFNSGIHSDKQGCRASGKKAGRAKKDASLSGIMALGAALSGRRYSDMLREFGLTTSMAFISRYVLRRSLYVRFDDLIHVSRIYSHVFGLARMYTGRCVIAVNYSLVVRRDSPVLERFKELADRTNLWFTFPWTTGLVRLSGISESSGWLPAGHLQHTREVGAGGDGFDLVEEMFAQMARQFRLCLETNSRQQLPSRQELLEFLNYFDDLPPRMLGIPEAYLDIHSKCDRWLLHQEDLVGKLESLRQSRGRHQSRQRLEREISRVLLQIHKLRTQVQVDQPDSRSESRWRDHYVGVANWAKFNSVLGPVLMSLLKNDRSVLGRALRKVHSVALNRQKG